MASAYSSRAAFSAGFQLLAAFFLWLLLQSRVGAQNRSAEVRALLRFKDDNGAPYSGYWLTWQETDENPCGWVGVVCTASSTVSRLDLSGWSFKAPKGFLYVEALSNLTDLQELDVSLNLVSGIEGTGSLTGLTLLNLSSTDWEYWGGGFPDLSNMTKLTLLDLSYNGIYGEIAPGISACRNLRYLYLQGNQLDGGISSLHSLANLQILLLADNGFSGPFPQELKGLTRLVTLDLSGNFFNGTIPALPDLTKLVYFSLDKNYFTEFETDWFVGANYTLCELTVSVNQIGGPIPSSITALQALQVLNMSRNRLSGGVPFGFSGLLSRGISLDLSQNQLTGNLPADILSPAYNACYWQEGYFNDDLVFVAGFMVNISQNLLSGSIPPLHAPSITGADGGLSSCFAAIDLSHNNLSGKVPWNSFLGNITEIFSLVFEDNQLSGDIVDVLVQDLFWRLQGLYLQNNLFTGDLSRIADMKPWNSDVSQFPRLMDFRSNHLRWSSSEENPDPIQATLGRIANSASPYGDGSAQSDMFVFRAGGNNFSGTSLPSTCFCLNCSFPFWKLDLSNSQLNGEISSGVFDSTCLPYLEFLDLSNNRITGPVPESIFTIPSLLTLDVSNNRLTGPLPLLPLNSSLTDPSSYARNAELCGYPLQTVCPGAQSGLPRWALVIIISGSVTVAVALLGCLAATWRWRVYRRMHQQDADLIKALLERDAASLMSLRELRKATGNFASSAQIGQGGFGTVYFGKLNDGTTVAIKRSKREGSDSDKEQFLNEVRILSQVNHRNLVKLIGCCMENKVAVLVFEYVSNGTLQEHLQGKMGDIRLTWKQRLNIAVQTAEALNYLHSAAMFPIYHRDVKSANILLDADLNAKVADFGISRLAPLHATHVSTLAVQGTMGYIDPEYYTSYKLTDKSDVYSFGVVLLELISAKPALDFLRGGEGSSLVIFASPYIERGDLREMLDPALVETYMDWACHGKESILSVAKLAMICVDMRSKARPSMQEVLKELQIILLDTGGTSTYSDYIKADEDARRDHIVLLSDSFCGDSSTFSVDGDAYDIELSQFSRPSSSKSRSTVADSHEPARCQ